MFVLAACATSPPETSVSADLDGLMITLETSDEPLDGVGVSPLSPSDIGLKPGQRILYIKAVAQNSTESTLTGLVTSRPIPSVTDDTGAAAEILSNQTSDSDVFPSLASETDDPLQQSFGPGGSLTTWSIYKITEGDEYTVRWEFSPDRVAELAVR